MTRSRNPSAVPKEMHEVHQDQPLDRQGSRSSARMSGRGRCCAPLDHRGGGQPGVEGLAAEVDHDREWDGGQDRHVAGAVDALDL